MRQTPLELDLECVVFRAGGVADQDCLGIIGVRRKYLRSLYQSSPYRPDVGTSQALLFSQTLLQRDVPLKRVRQFEFRVESKHRSRARSRPRDGRRRGNSCRQRKGIAKIEFECGKRVGELADQ